MFFARSWFHVKEQVLRQSESMWLKYDEILLENPVLYYVTAVSKTELRISSKKNQEICCLDIGESGIMTILPSKIDVLSGEIRLKKENILHLAKMQAFIDKANNQIHNFKNNYLSAFINFNFDTYKKQKNLEYWFLSQQINKEKKAERFSSLLRQNEEYRIVCFLLEESMLEGNQKLQKMSIKYGLSVSYFRKLAGNALGNSPKTELKKWRLVNALLDLNDKNQNITQIAFKYGYSNLSHFSDEVKSFLGISPSRLKRYYQKKGPSVTNEEITDKKR